jgi:hypothetical protein
MNGNGGSDFPKRELYAQIFHGILDGLAEIDNRYQGMKKIPDPRGLVRLS